MGKLTVVLVVGALVGAGYGIAKNWDRIRNAAGITETSPEELRAVGLARADYNLDRYRTNHDVMRSRATANGQKGVPNWKAERKSTTIFFVTCAITPTGIAQDEYFEVDVGARVVRPVRGDADAEERYGIPATPR